MDKVSNTRSDTGRLIDLTSQTDVQYWCRVFDVSMDELRFAVHHAGHQVAEVERYLRARKTAGGSTRSL